MDILEHADAQALLADAELSAAAVRSCANHLEAFVARYPPLFARKEQRNHARTLLAGKLTGLQRKTAQPIATHAAPPRPTPHPFALAAGWVTGEDEFGGCSELRAQLRWQRRRYVRDVPCPTLVRDPQERRPATRPGGRPRLPEFERVDRWAARQPKGRWRKVKVRDGEKGPLEVQVLLATVQTRDDDGCAGPVERLAGLRTLEPKPQTWYTLSNAKEAKRAELARVHGGRHRVEELLAESKGEVGLAHYEVRSWVGWHHHMTLSLLALWFLELERLRLGKKNAARDSAAGT